MYSGFSVGVCLTDITNPSMKLIAIIMLMIKGFFEKISYFSLYLINIDINFSVDGS